MLEETKERTKEYIKDHAEKYNWENENKDTKLEAANYNVGLKTGYEDGFQDGVNFGYNKANEWNFVKDEKYPTHEQYVTVLYQNCDKLNTYTCLYDTHSKLWMYYNLDNMWLEKFDYKVLAWKEIVFPELKG